MRQYVRLICGVIAILMTFIGLVVGIRGKNVLEAYHYTVDLHFEEDAVTVNKLEDIQSSDQTFTGCN